MPATAGRVRMPANNRVHSSAALQTHGIWQSAIGYDPYAPSKEEKKGSVKKVDSSSSDPKAGENTYASFQGLIALAKITNSNMDEFRGACKMCGRVGHLTFQCRNFLSIKDNEDRDREALTAKVRSEFDKMKKIKGKVNGGESEESESESEEETESEDSDYDSDMEREVAKRFGKKVIGKLKRKDLDDDREDKKKRGRSRKRRSGKKVDSDSDSEDNGGKTRRKEKRRSDGRESRREKGSRTSHRRSEDSDEFENSDERRNRRAAADRDNSRLEDSRVGRERKKRPEKKTRKHSYEREDRYAVNMSY